MDAPRLLLFAAVLTSHAVAAGPARQREKLGRGVVAVPVADGGDWREEIIAPTRDGRELRIFSTPIPAKHRLVTLMHDPVYRLAIAWQNTGYNQPAHTSFFMADALK
ncbi:MAG TPA: hypothetical protein VG796_17955 [Verrucomicrobiales bacterium]|nr:hypothetical protein [Verrucomicrobiales bacterium]